MSGGGLGWVAGAYGRLMRVPGPRNERRVIGMVRWWSKRAAGDNWRQVCVRLTPQGCSVNKWQHHFSSRHLTARMTKTNSALTNKLQKKAKMTPTVKAQQVSHFSACFQPSGSISDHLSSTLIGETGPGRKGRSWEHCWQQWGHNPGHCEHPFLPS